MVRSALLAALLLIPVSAQAEYLTGDRSHTQSAPDAEFWEYQNQPMEHDKGFYLRATLGPSWFTTRTRQIGPELLGTRLRVEGAGLETGVALGGVVAHDLVLHGSLLALVSPSPRVVSENGTSIAGDAGFVLAGFGPGITGYLPSNVFASISFGGSIIAFDFRDATLIEPDNGYGIFFDMTFGKEWWVGNYAGIGLFGRFTAHRANTDYPEPFGGVTLSTGLSFSLN